MHIRLGRPASAGLVAVALALIGAALAPTATGAVSGDRTARVEYFTDGGHGRTKDVPVRAPHRDSARPLSAVEAAADGAVTPLSQTGSTGERLDVAVIGDGYTLAEQDGFLADARARWAEVSAIEPYRSYTGLMNVWAVGAVSNQSGISGDPTSDVVRDTALGSYFWCDGIERLICADLDKVKSYADLAPAADLVVVISNSAKYGGAGYQELQDDYGYAGVSTLSSDNARSSLIAAHEIGHSIGFLADEYTYPTYGTYHGGEVPYPNSSVLTADRMAARQTKWHRWLGEADPSGGTVGTYEGAFYHPLGIYRPTQTSIMLTLASTEFNLPSREALIAGFYDYAVPLSGASGGATATDRDTPVSVTLAPLTPGLSDLQVRWYVDGREATAARGATQVVPGDLGVPAGDGRTHAVQARVTDMTASLRDPDLRAGTTATRTWLVTG
ncbi:M64 family metallopeptidase [Streptomyces sp. NPDC051940]|uniref:M64 family metallopeptidase n=1 Tax=Streptomyces sp. NPDC051940 TaxID=3155675 RepID=UPI003415CDA9